MCVCTVYMSMCRCVDVYPARQHKPNQIWRKKRKSEGKQGGRKQEKKVRLDQNTLLFFAELHFALSCRVSWNVVTYCNSQLRNISQSPPPFSIRETMHAALYLFETHRNPRHLLPRLPPTPYRYPLPHSTFVKTIAGTRVPVFGYRYQ